MSCNRCEVVPPAVEPDYVLLSMPHVSTRDKIMAHLRAAGASCDVTELGVKLWCRDGGTNWELLLQMLSAAMTEPERSDTRVAVVPRSGNPMALHEAIFRSRTLAQVVAQIGDSWLYDVLRKDDLAVHFHPLVEAPPGRVLGYECLMRGVGADGKLIAPGRMFDAARSLDMLFLLDQKCRLAAVRHAAATGLRDVSFFINFVPTAIYNPAHCLKTTMEAVRAAGLGPERITFEVVETEEVSDRKHLTEILRFYREQGFKVALDDVGAGYSSLLSLSDLRPDYIKLDGEFVRRAAQGSLEGKIIRDLAEAARQHGITTIAEGVETDEQLQFIRDLGIRITQGYVHCKPQPAPLDAAQVRAVLGRVNAARPMSA